MDENFCCTRVFFRRLDVFSRFPRGLFLVNQISCTCVFLAVKSHSSNSVFDVLRFENV